MLIQYISRRFSGESAKRIGQANEIIEEYKAQGYELTLRQLYYQFVARDLIANTMREYKNLGSIINDARLAGLVSWEAIVDRTRNLQSNSHWDSPSDIVDACVENYRTDKWKDQAHRVEVWIEKDALIGVIERACTELDVPYFSCRGYTSQSEMHEAALRIKIYEREGYSPALIHLGDHDPSGKDMSRDIQDRLALFGSSVEVDRIALNMDQIRKYKPPPNPAKITDSRAKNYISEFGKSSWELDALDPKVLDSLIRKKILSYRDELKWKKSAAVENGHISELQKAAKRLRD